jgi:hypothetical protein
MRQCSWCNHVTTDSEVTDIKDRTFLVRTEDMADVILGVRPDLCSKCYWALTLQVMSLMSDGPDIAPEEPVINNEKEAT